jgi:hypothetical protein
MLQVFFGIPDAKQNVLDIFGKSRNTSLGHLDYTELFNPGTSQVYFDDLRKIISKYWDCFKNVLGSDQEKVLQYLKLINDSRADAHAKGNVDDDFQMLRLAFTFLETRLNEFAAEM